MRYLLDTNVVSELRKRDADPHVFSWIAGRATRDLTISVITVMEIEIGVARAERRDARQGRALRTWFEQQVLGAFVGRVLPLGLDSARRAARMQVPDPRPDRDTMIAAIALTNDLVVVTRNVSDFSTTGVDLVNPWEPVG